VDVDAAGADSVDVGVATISGLAGVPAQLSHDADNAAADALEAATGAAGADGAEAGVAGAGGAGDGAGAEKAGPAAEAAGAAADAGAAAAASAPATQPRGQAVIDLAAADGAAEDDLERIEGIGPRISSAMHMAGIHTFRALADSDVATLQAALEKAGLRFAPSLPTWARQARFLADGDEAGFIALTEQLVAGRDPGRGA
jgi:predicted flap endonuclease-1-like 5' DNA nuclease